MDPDADVSRRRAWLAVLAHGPRDELQRFAAALESEPFEWLRSPQVGLVMLRARVANSGDRFNLGDAPVTRCVVRHRGADGFLSAGVGCVLGRDAERATWVARIDALLQQPTRHDAVLREVIHPLSQATARMRARAAARTATSRVHFTTLNVAPT